jgi:uncharacterized Zn finger protein
MSMTPSNTASPPPSRVPPPLCPQCQQAMRIRVVEPVMFARDVDDMTYRCENCGTETKRAVKRS